MRPHRGHGSGPRARTLLGGRAAPPVERAGFGALTAFAATIQVSRTINYVRERRRNVPVLRSIVRRVIDGPLNGPTEVHHFLPGIAIAFTTGAGAIVTQDRRAFQLSVPFGVGAALTLDELEVMLGRDHPYWGSEHFAQAQSVVAGLAAAALALRFHRRGAPTDSG